MIVFFDTLTHAFYREAEGNFTPKT